MTSTLNIAPTSYSCLRVSRHPDCRHVVIVSLNRPHKKNAICSTMWKEIGHCFRTVHEMGDVRAVILTGHGPCFTTGLCLSDPTLLSLNKNSQKESPSSSASSSSRFSGGASGGGGGVDPARVGLAFLPKIREMQSCFTDIEKCPVPVIAAIHSFCIGAGVDLITACDVRLCSDDSKFSVREVVVGLAADVGTLQRLPKVVGNDSRIRELCFTGEMFDANEAQRIGLVSRVIPSSSSKNVLCEALKLATTIAQHSPVAVIGTKQSLLFSRDHSVADGLDHIATHNALALQSQDLTTAFVAATKKKQRGKPNFDDVYPYSRL